MLPADAAAAGPICLSLHRAQRRMRSLDFYLTDALNTRMDPLSTTFAALADPTRRAILARLAQGEAHVGEIGRPFRISAPAVSRHLRVLEQAGPLEREVDAQWRVCRLHGPGMRAAHDWIGQYREFWERSLDRLADYLEQAPARSPRHPSRSRAAPSAMKKPRRRRSKP